MDRLWNPAFEASTLTQPDQGNIDMRYPNGTPHGDRYAPFNADQRPSRTYQNSAEQEEDTGKQTQRRRITVACGRCRKRKIRCSGPQGESGCQNCRTAGNDNCQFNRVSAEDMVFKDNFTYDSYLTNRALPLRNTNLYTQSYSPYSSMVPLGSNVPYQQNIDYHYNDRASTYNSQYPVEFAEEIQDYSSISYHQSMHHPHETVDLGYNNVGLPPQRSWTPVPLPSQKPVLTQPYYEPGYAQPTQHHQVPHYSQSYTVPLRSSISSETNFNLGAMTNNLPVSSRLTSHERVLPIPSSGPMAKYADPLGYNGAILPSNVQGIMPLSVKPINTAANVVGLSHLDGLADASQTHGAYDQSYRPVEDDSDATPVSVRSNMRNEF